MKVGIPRSLFYYYYGTFWQDFLDSLKVNYIISPNTNKEILEKGSKIAADEMCLSLKIYLGHIDYLKDKCDYILVPRISNFKNSNQTCTNFWAIYDIINNIFDINILNYNIDLEKRKTLKKGLYKIGKTLNKKKREIKKAYKYALLKEKKKIKRNHNINLNKLKVNKKKILIVSHPYNTYDEIVGKNIIKYLKENNIELIYSDKFDPKIVNPLSKKISHDLYFKYSKDNLGSIIYSEKYIDGIIFISAFPCAPDSLANELAMRKINKPYLNLVIDENLSFAGLETRLESFIDMLGEIK